MTITLPADVYDTLALSAEAYGGIGAGRYMENDEPGCFSEAGIPLCVAGHAYTAGLCDDPSHIFSFGLNWWESDNGVSRLLAVNEFRVSFAAWCAELDVVRGE